jgi:hemolysin activation/secretion protein
LSVVVLLAAWTVAGAAAEPAAVPTAAAPSWPEDAELEAQGARIGSVTIHGRPIFDPEKPGENKTLFQLADRLHVDTRESVIDAQLLFQPGDPYSRRVLDETERNLRELAFIHEPVIRVVGYHDGLVDLEVVARDVWTTNLGFSFGHAGGKSATGILLEERNLLGFGKEVAISYNNDVDRNSYTLRWLDPSVAGSRWRSAVALTDSDDGTGATLQLERPFYSLDTRWSAGASFDQGDSNESVYRLGFVVSEYQRDAQAADLHFGWSEGLRNGWARRWNVGLRHEEAKFSESPDAMIPVTLPQDRSFSYPFLRLEGVQDDFKTARNLDQIARTEDQHFGIRYALELGLATTAFGSDRNAALLRAEASRGLRIADGRLLLIAGGLKSRIEDGSARDALLSGRLRYYWHTSPRSTFFASLTGDIGHDLDADHELYLGGDNGLRGYPLRYQTGSSRALLTVEQRYYSKYSLWKLADIGGAVFFDMGRTWGDSAFGPTGGQGMLKDIGFGLRLGANRSALGSVHHLDVAFPLDGDHSISQVQILVHTERSF